MQPSFHGSISQMHMATGKELPVVTSIPFVILHHIAKDMQLPLIIAIEGKTNSLHEECGSLRGINKRNCLVAVK